MLVTSIFSFSHNVFLPIKDTNHYFSNILFAVCNCYEFPTFTTMFSSQSKTQIIILAKFYLLSANAMNLVKSKKLSFGKSLNTCQIIGTVHIIIDTVPGSPAKNPVLSVIISQSYRRSFCDELCQLCDVTYKTRCLTLFHTEHHQSSFISNFHIFCYWNENNDGVVIFRGDLSFHWYIGR